MMVPDWLRDIGILILVVLLTNLVLRGVFYTIQKNQKKLPPKVGVFLATLNSPLRIYLWFIAGFYILHKLLYSVLETKFEQFNEVVSIGTLCIIVWTSIRLIKNLETDYIKKYAHQKDRSFATSGVKALSHLAKIVVFTIGGLILLGIFHIPLSGLLTFGGVSGLAMAYAGKNIASNFIGGVMIYVNREFSVGDSIHSPDRDIEGTVEEIGWNTTTIRRLDKQVMYVSNGVFDTLNLINTSRMSHRLIHQTIGIRFDDAPKIPEILNALRDYIEKHADIDLKAGVKINLTEFSASSVNFQIYVYTTQTDLQASLKIQDDILLKASEIMRSFGVKHASATPTIQLKMDAK